MTPSARRTRRHTNRHVGNDITARPHAPSLTIVTRHQLLRSSSSGLSRGSNHVSTRRNGCGQIHYRRNPGWQQQILGSSPRMTSRVGRTRRHTNRQTGDDIMARPHSPSPTIVSRRQPSPPSSPDKPEGHGENCRYACFSSQAEITPSSASTRASSSSSSTISATKALTSMARALFSGMPRAIR